MRAVLLYLESSSSINVEESLPEFYQFQQETLLDE